ncbi:MAG: 3-isopropylmalate dehydrogenase [Paracoccaceae bacterium]|nr:3-isopropylmalate dehydrogenase [Paracoccaceae bacterium]
MKYTVLALGGDGIGPEILKAGIDVANAIVEKTDLELDISYDLIGGICWDKHQTFCQSKTVSAAQKTNAVLVGAVGGPKWDKLKIDVLPEERDGLMRLRKEMRAFFGMRPARYYPQLHNQTPYAKGKVENSELMVLREMCGGAMFAQPRGIKIEKNQRYAYDTAGYAETEIRQFAVCGFELARLRKNRLVSIDKSNVMESYRLWREVVQEVSNEYKNVEVKHLYADNCAFQIAMDPKKFDIVLACNFLGDLFSDLAGIISGGLGMLPSASLCGPPIGLTKGIYEPVHGSAPDLIGAGIANPIGMILSVGMMFNYSFGRKDLSNRIEHAVNQVLEAGCVTPDVGGTASTDEVTTKVVKEIQK